MHGAGTGEIHVRKRKKFTWLVDMTLSVSAAFKIVNFGKEFRHFFEVIEALKELDYDINFRFPRFFSETKFANYSRLVYKSFRETYAALIRTLEESFFSSFFSFLSSMQHFATGGNLGHLTNTNVPGTKGLTG